MQYPNTLRRQAVQSEAVHSIGYDEDNWLLQVEFVGGKVFNYLRVPPEEYAKLRRAESVDRFLKREVERYYESEEAEAAHA
ncbi:KTSC domain-containing protein [Ramlibacter sp. PS4R-6]|uniref:KTSC domain-containing protein n=1 Tax=Ramlibacter sp. PS4R-6 TaxID=3133438 RepID=UPI003099EC16